MTHPASWTEDELTSLQGHGWIDEIHHHTEIDSTNNWALGLARADERPQGAVHLVLADQQTAGRGRRSHVWTSSSGALLASLLLNATDLGIPQSVWPLVSLVTALCLCEAVEERCPDRSSQVKWPNDLLLDGQKLAGILVENDGGQFLVVGFGMNVANTVSDIPGATSLVEEGVRPHQIIEAFLSRFPDRLRELMEGGEQWRNAFTLRHVLHGESVIVHQDERAREGRVEGLDERGGLVLIAPDGKRLVCYAGQVEWSGRVW